MRELDGVKGKQSIPQRMERVMKPTPGPRAPGNLAAISLYAEIEKELHHWLGTLANPEIPTPHTAVGMLSWIAFHAYDIADQSDADAFQEDLARWCSLVEKAVGRGPSIKKLAGGPEPRHTARTIVDRLHKMGYDRVTRQHLSTWAARGHISVEIRGNKPCYLMTDVLGWMTRGTPD